MAALLEISIDRIKVVDIRRGSTIVVTQILSENSAEDDRDNKEEVVKEFEEYEAKFKSAVENEEVDFGAPVLDINSEMVIDDVEPVDDPNGDGSGGSGDGDGNGDGSGDRSGNGPEGEDGEGGDNTLRNVLMGVLIPVGVIAIGVAVFFIVKKMKAPKASKTTNDEMNVTNKTENGEFVNMIQSIGGDTNYSNVNQIQFTNNEQINSYADRR
jgi:hypothetical protein